MKPADCYFICKKDVWSHSLLGNEAKDSATESKLPKSKTSSKMSRELNLSKTPVPVGKASPLTDSGAAHHKGDNSLCKRQDLCGGLSKITTGCRALWNSSKLHCFQFHPIIISNGLFQLIPMKRDKVVNSMPCRAALRLQACFRDPKVAEQTKAKSPVPQCLPQLKHTPQNSTDLDEVLQRCLSSHSAYVNIEMAETRRRAVTCEVLAGPTTRKAIILPWRNYVVLTVADSKPALNRCPPGIFSAFAD